MPLSSGKIEDKTAVGEYEPNVNSFTQYSISDFFVINTFLQINMFNKLQTRDKTNLLFEE